MEWKRRIAIALVFLMVVSIIDFSGFYHLSASTLDEQTVIQEEPALTLSEDTIQTDTVSTPEIQDKKEDSVSSQELEELLEKDSQNLEEQTTSGVPEGITVDGNYKRIYANGNAITIKAVSEVSTNALIYYDKDLDKPINIIGIEGDTTEGYDLSKYFIFGGSLTGSVSATSVTMRGGSVGNIYGGGNDHSSVSGNTTVTINGGEIVGGVCGGGIVDSSVSGTTTVTISGGKIGGFVYGGGHYNSSVSGNTTVTISGGKIGRDVYGGGFNDSSVSGNTTVTINGGEIGEYVYAGGSYNSSVSGNTMVTISGGKIGRDVYGGGFNNSSVSGTTTVTISGGEIVGYVFCGGNGKSSVSGNTMVTISGGKIGRHVFGGGNGESSVSGTTTVTISGGEIVGNVYGGGSIDFSTYVEPALVKIGVDAVVKGSVKASGVNSPSNSSSHVEYEVAFYDGTTKLTDPNSNFKPQWVISGNKAKQPDPNPSDSIGKLLRGCKDKDSNTFDFTTSISAPQKLFIDWGYTVSYNGNGNDGGTIPVDNYIYPISDNVTVSGNTGNLTKYGYNFGGWSISQNGTPITEYTVGLESMTFYAVWVPKPTNLLNVINGTGGGNYWEGQSVTVTADSRAGHTFTNWTSDDDGSFTNSKSATTTFLMPDKPVTVSANYSTDDHYLIDEKTAEGFPEGKDKKGYATITLKKTSYVYTGSEIRPVPVVSFTYTEYDDTGKQTGKAKTKKLVENVDYTLSYANNSNVGTVLSLGKILITGIGDYKDTMTKNFTITPKSLKSAVMEPIEDVKSTGADLKAQMDAQIVVKDGVNTVSKNDYKVLYQINNQEQNTLPRSVTAKTAVKVSVTGKNNYKDTIKKTQTFTILPQNSNATSVADDFKLTVKVPKKGYTYSGKAMKPKIIVTSKKGTKVKLNKDYKISYQNNVNAGTNTGTIMVSGKNNYYGSVSLNFTIEQKDISKVKVKTLSKIVHRDSIEDLELTITDDSRYLKKGEDYTVDFSSSKDLSLGVLKVKKVTLSVNALENSNYTGKKEVTCYIIPRNLTNKITTKIECPNVTYTDEVAKEGAKPVPVIHYNGDQLEKDKHFKIVKYINNKKNGTGKVVIQGIGDYTGKRTVKFQIIQGNKK